MQVVDPHIHLWDLKTHHYPWLANPGTSFVGDARDLKHDYLISDLLRDAEPIQVLKLVHVDANHDPAVQKHHYKISVLRRNAEPIQVLNLVHVDANHDPADPVEETRWLQHVAD